MYYIYKFDSSRLKEFQNNITINPNQGRRNGELIAIGDNQVLRSIRNIKGIETDKDKIKSLKRHLKSVSKKLVDEAQYKIDELLLVPEVVSIVMHSKGDYRNIIKKGLWINGKKYVRLLCGAGHARKNTVIFCSEDIEKPLKSLLHNGKKDIEIAHAKYNAYFGLYSSATHRVSNPRVCVVPDYIVKRKCLVDWVEEYDDGDTVEEREMELEFNLWDGMGLISPTFAKQWAEDMGIKDYIPSAFTIRHSFIKGMVCAFDFVEFARQVSKQYNTISDIWGNPINDIRKYDVILTESQFKLWNAYDSWDNYVDNCKQNKLYWGVSRAAPKQEKHYTFLNYQYIQAIKTDIEGIKNLAQPTIDWINDLLHMDANKALLFLTGNSLCNYIIDGFLDLDGIEDPVIKALIINKDVLNDTHVKNKIYRLINKRIKDAHIGKLICEGNYQVMISDPYALCEYLFGMEVKGLLNNKEHYANYWNEKNIYKVVAMRSPLTDKSEVNVLNLQKSEDTEHWYQYITSGIIYNVHGVDTMVHADSDFDYDIVMTTNSPEFINGAQGGLPITYTKKSVLKMKIDENHLYVSDMYSFNSKIGSTTNNATTLDCMLADYREGSIEYNEIIRRKKICRKQQGAQIDKTKGLMVKEFPKEWLKQQGENELDDKLVLTKKPLFMKYLYSNMWKKYKDYVNSNESRSQDFFKCGIEQLKQIENKNEDMIKFLDNYKNYLPLNDAPCTMNLLCEHMEHIHFNTKHLLKNNTFDYTLFTDKAYKVNRNSSEYRAILNIYREYNKHKQSLAKMNDEFSQEGSDSIEKYYTLQTMKVCPLTTAVTIMIDIYHNTHPTQNHNFMWNVCAEGIIQNLKNNSKNKIEIPILDSKGDILYLGDGYRLQEVDTFENFK